MKTEQLKTKIKKIIDNEPRFIDQINTKDLKEKLETKKGIECSIPMLNKVMLSIVGETEDGYPTDDGNLVMGEDSPNKGKSTGLTKYYWFIT